MERPNGAWGCSHGWSEAALGLAEPVEVSLFFDPAPAGQRSRALKRKGPDAGMGDFKTELLR